MSKKKLITQGGFTYIELLIAILFVAIVIPSIGLILVDGQRGWNTMYNRIYSDVVTDSYIARKTFDAVIRKASREKMLLDEDGNWLEVYYYADSDSTVVDRYARFYYYDGGQGTRGQLNIEYGTLKPKKTLSTHTVCKDVSGCVFRRAGRSAQMILTLDNGSQTATVVCSAVMHNQ